jgi:hypothetical protein
LVLILSASLLRITLPTCLTNLCKGVCLSCFNFTLPCVTVLADVYKTGCVYLLWCLQIMKFITFQAHRSNQIKLLVIRVAFQCTLTSLKRVLWNYRAFRFVKNITINYIDVRYELSIYKILRVSQNIGLLFGDWILLHNFLLLSHILLERAI